MKDDAPKKEAAESALEKKKPAVCQPFTPRGVAAFALAPVARILCFQIVAGLLSAAVVIWFLNANYSPAISDAIKNLPDKAAFQNGALTNVSSGPLAQGTFLSFVIDLEETGKTGQTADLQVELRPDYFQICSIFGCGLFVYPGKNISIGRSTAEPWWGARQPVILALAGLSTFIGVWLSWIFLAVIYAPVAKAIAYYADRELSWTGSWRLASAAQIPAALVMLLAIVLYGLRAFDLIRFLFFFGAHFVVAWIYVGAASMSLPHVSDKSSPAKNPFQ